MTGQKQQQQNTIDLSAGLVPATSTPAAQQPPAAVPAIDLSAGLTPSSGQDQAQQPPQRGVIGKAWDWLNKGLVSGDTLMKASTNGEENMGSVRAEANSLPDDWDVQHPILGGIRKGAYGMSADTMDTLSGFTSPLSIATMALGAAGRIPGVAGKIARAMSAAAGAGFAAKGGADVADAGLKNTPEAWQQRLTGGSMVAGGGAAAAEPVSRFGKGSLSARMQEPSGAGMTRGDVLQAATDKGVNLDVSDATGSGVAKGAKAYAERSLGGRGTMKANVDQNVAALNDWAQNELGTYDRNDFSHEGLGSKVQEQLKSDFEEKKADATQGFKDLDERVGPNTIDGTQSVEAEARKIVSEQKPYYDKHPELRPKQAWGILENLAKRPQVAVEQASPGVGFAGEGGTTTAMKDAPAHNFSWSELHQLRSDLMEAYRNSPDLTKSQPEAWLQRMVKTIDDTMTNASSGLSPEDRAQFRQANGIWEGIKSTYDNPQHPFFAAVRSQFPTQVPGMLSNKTPELARQVNGVLGDLKGPYQRDFVRSLLNPNGDGHYDLKGLEGRVSKLPDEYLTEQLGQDGAQRLKSLARVSKIVTDNLNPSGTSDVMVPAGEIGSAATMLLTHPVGAGLTLAGELAAGKGTASALTSRGTLNRLIGPKPAPRGVVRGSLAATVASSRQH